MLIDGVDTSTLKLSGLRSRLAIIPQDPVLFNDSLRYNLDPFSEHSDAALQQVMKHAPLESAVANLDNDPSGALKLATGSFGGMLRLYYPRERDFKLEDLMLEQNMEK